MESVGERAFKDIRTFFLNVNRLVVELPNYYTAFLFRESSEQEKLTKRKNYTGVIEIKAYIPWMKQGETDTLPNKIHQFG